MAWPAILGAAIGAGSGLLSGWLNNNAAMARQHDANNFSAGMYGNRYQIMVRDLKRAGLNPMLAYMNGPGGSPSGATSGSSGYGNFGEAGVSSYNTTRIASAQEANLNAGTLKTVAETKNTEADTLYKLGLPEYLVAQIQATRNSAEQTAIVTEKIKQEIPKVLEEINTLKTQQEKNKADTSYAQKLTDSQNYLNMLQTAQAVLTGSQTKGQELENLIKDPKAKASQSTIGAYGSRAEQMWKIFNPFSNILNK